METKLNGNKKGISSLFNNDNGVFDAFEIAKGTPFEKDYDSLVNLTLVYYGGRDIFLFESSNYPNIELPAFVFQVLFSNNGFDFYTENKQLERIIIYKSNNKSVKSKIDKLENSTMAQHDIILGDLLGFTCPSELGSLDKIGFAISYSIVSLYTGDTSSSSSGSDSDKSSGSDSEEDSNKDQQSFNLTAEICYSKSISELEKAAKVKVNKWNDILRYKTKLPYIVEYKVTELIPPKKWFNVVLNQEWNVLEKRIIPFRIFVNSDFEQFFDYIFEGKTDKEAIDLLAYKYYYLFLFEFFCDLNECYLMRPLKPNEYNSFLEMQKKIIEMYEIFLKKKTVSPKSVGEFYLNAVIDNRNFFTSLYGEKLYDEYIKKLKLNIDKFAELV